MSELPSDADVVVVGAGIVGSCLARHLIRLGWRNVVVLDKGLLPAPGGSTGHASSFLFPVDHSREITLLTQDSIRQYQEIGVFSGCGGMELARTGQRLEELKRRAASALAWGEPAELLAPAGVQELVPYVDPRVIVGGFHTPGVGVIDSVRACEVMQTEAQRAGGLTVVEQTEVVGLEVEGGRVVAVRTDRGDVRTDRVVVCCGIWSPRLARMAGAHVPLTPAVHQMIQVGPIAAFSGAGEQEVLFPIVRDMDAGMYERPKGEDLQIGSYAHRPILLDPDDIPSLAEAERSPTELPFTEDDFRLQIRQARELMPDILEDPGLKQRYAINGLLSLTPDSAPVIGESPEVGGLWVAAAIWIKEAAGVARIVAQWMSGEKLDIDPRPADIARFYPPQRTRAFIRARASEGFNKTYGIVHPAEQWTSSRDLRLSPFHQREQNLGAEFVESAGWERPNWYRSNEALLDVYGDRIALRSAEWDSRWWSPIINAEHLAMRDRVGLVDLTAFAVFDVAGPAALDYVQRLAVNQLDVPVGRVVYTPLLSEHGGLVADLTITRLGVNQFRVVTGGATGMVDKKWFEDHLPTDGSAQLHDATSAWCTLGVWGPRARGLLSSVSTDDLSHEGFPFATCRAISVGPLQVLASRISYVGEQGWELYVPIEQGARLWDLLWEAGQEHGALPVGVAVYLTTGRLEKCYRAYGNELMLDYDIVESGLARKAVKPQAFIGKQAYLRQRESEPAAVLCTLTVDGHIVGEGTSRYMLGHEPVLTPSGEPAVDRKGRRSYVTSAGAGPSVGEHILMAYLPPELARQGTPLLVEYFGERYPVTVAVAGNRPLFDPENRRIRS